MLVGSAERSGTKKKSVRRSIDARIIRQSRRVMAFTSTAAADWPGRKWRPLRRPSARAHSWRFPLQVTRRHIRDVQPDMLTEGDDHLAVLSSVRLAARATPVVRFSPPKRWPSLPSVYDAMHVGERFVRTRILGGAEGRATALSSRFRNKLGQEHEHFRV